MVKIKKIKEKSRGEQFRAILGGMGVRLEDCRVLCFTFEKERGAENFHYDLMREIALPYFIFDAAGNDAYIVMPIMKPKAVSAVERLASLAGGVAKVPEL